jgi:hypothetical protein
MPLNCNRLIQVQLGKMLHDDKQSTADCVDAIIELNHLKVLDEQSVGIIPQSPNFVDSMIDQITEKLRSKSDITPQLMHSMMTGIPMHLLTVIMTRLLATFSVKPIPVVAEVSNRTLVHDVMIQFASVVVPAIQSEKLLVHSALPSYNTKKFAKISQTDFTIQLA